MSRRLCLIFGALVATVSLAGGLRQADGQFQVRPLGPAGAPADDQQSRVQPPTDRTLSRGVQRAQESIASGEFVQAIRFLDDVLGRNEDVFVETGSDGGFAGLKDTARRLIRDLPPEGRAAYEAAAGPTAQRMLQQATAAGDPQAIEAIAQRYFYTPAGYEAAILAATDEADSGRHLSAALIYDQLLDTPEAVRRYDPELSVRAAASWLAAGEPDRAGEVLAHLAARGQQTIEIAGREHRLDSTAEPLDWLRKTVGNPAGDSPAPHRQWITYRGNAARNGETNGGLPHMRVRWSVRLMSHPRLESLFEDYAANLARNGGAVPVAGVPLAAGDSVLVRSPDGLLAIDFRTGKRIWRTEPQNDPNLKQLIRGGSDEQATNPEAVRSFARRMWEDYLYGLASSDGARVFVIRDLPMPPAQEYELGPFMGGPITETPVAANRLCAYDLATQGKLVWEVDGATIEGDLAGAFFLGAPVAVGPSLYALAEIKDDVYLVALDRSTGQLQWRQLLAHLEAGVLMDLERRLQASMPSYEGGVLVCPTGAGLVVGVDLAKQSLQWAYRYPAAPRTDAMYRASSLEDARAAHWTDGAATIVGDRVVITPPESRELHCLDLRTGKLLWKHDRGDMLRLACVHDGRVVLVGAKTMTALNLADGKPAWDPATLELPGGAAASGSGFLSEGKYYLPLTTAEVAAIDVSTGRVVARAASRNGQPLGNLICHRGSVISQNGLFLDCFDQVDVLRQRSERRLAKNANDVEALRTLGEVAFNDGRLSEAIELLERAYQADRQDMATRDVLAECLASALDEDFTAYRARLPLLKELEDGMPARRLQLLRIESQGLLQEHDPLGAAAACIELYRLAGPNDEPLSIGRDHQVAASRWVGGQLAAAWRQADADQRAKLDKQVLDLAQQVDRSPDAEPLERFLDFFGTLQAADGLKLTRARQLNDERRALEAQQLLLDLIDSPDEAVRREAIARIAAQLHNTATQQRQPGFHALAADYDRLLSGVYADQACIDGATGRELVARWRADTGESTFDWPQGKVEVASVAAPADTAGRARTPMRIVRWERTDGILGQVRALASSPARGGELLLEDGAGREFFRAALEQENPNQYRPPGNAYGVTHGNLVVVSLGRQLVAYNTLPAADGPTPAILWRAALANNMDLDQTYFDDLGGGASRRPGSFRPGRSLDRGAWIGVIGPVSGRSVVFQDQRRLVCVDAMTGEVQWSRTDVPPGCDLFGDDQFVFATPKDADEARMFDAVDGRDLGKAKVPRWSEQLATLGRHVVRWSRGDDNRRVLSSVDASTGASQWSQNFEPGAGIDVDQGRYAAVVEPTGRIVVVDLSDGRTLVDYQTAGQPSLEEIHLMVDSQGFLVATNRRSRTPTDRVVRPLSNSLDSAVVTGQLFYFDRQSGQARWSRPADVIQQALLINQPADLPFIAFAGTLEIRKRGLPGGDRVVSKTGATLLVIDKRTGRTLFSDDSLPAVNTGMCLARVKEGVHEAVLDMGSRTLTLQFTDGRRPPEPPTMAEVESSANRTSGGLMGIIRNLGEGASGGKR